MWHVHEAKDGESIHSLSKLYSGLDADNIAELNPYVTRHVNYRSVYSKLQAGTLIYLPEARHEGLQEGRGTPLSTCDVVDSFKISAAAAPNKGCPMCRRGQNVCNKPGASRWPS